MNNSAVKKNITKKQHYVPQTYLNNFAIDNKIVVIDKQNDSVYKNTVGNVACEKYFYEVLDKETNYFEKEYCKVEGKYRDIYNTIIINCGFTSNGGKVLNNYLKRKLSEFIISQLFRTPSSINYYYERINDFNENIIPSDKKIIFEKFETIEEFKSFYLDYINSRKFKAKIKSKILDKIWIIHKNEDVILKKFITSDNPIILVNLSNKKIGLENNYFNNDYMAIYYPLDREYLLAIYPKYKGLIKNDNRMSIIKNDNNFMKFYYKSIYDQSYRQVFFQVENDE